MAQLYLTSSFLHGELFLTLEQLFKKVEPENVILVFDANIVIYYRNFYLDSQLFIEKIGKGDVYHILRYLVEQVHRYNLAINASIGVEESSRNKHNFGLNEEKRNQTHQAVMDMFQMDINMLDNYIQRRKVVTPICDKTCLTTSKIEALTQESIFQNYLIVTYVAILKIYILNKEIERKKLSPREAYVQLYYFLSQEVNIMAALPLLFAFHLYGGANDFGKIIHATGGVNKEKKLHKLFNGAIDLVYPYLVNKAQEMHPTLYRDHRHIPIFVTLDAELAKLHTCYRTRIVFDSINRKKDEINYNPEVVDVVYPNGLDWSEEDLGFFKSLYEVNNANRLAHAFSGPLETQHLLPIVKKMEKQVLDLL